ncbi:MAG: hypothetical protein AAF500_09690 [Myxococcota bacterium]
MKALVTPAILALGIALIGIVMVGEANSVRAGSCYEIYGQVRDVGPGWAHIVVVENDCDYWLQCSVWTDVTPQPPAMITVGPGMSEKTQRTANSDQKEFKSYGICRRK